MNTLQISRYLILDTNLISWISYLYSVGADYNAADVNGVADITAEVYSVNDIIADVKSCRLHHSRLHYIMTVIPTVNSL